MKFKAGEPSDIRYYACSDLIAQVADELSNRPESCFSKNCISWYNSVYTELSEFLDCRYQVEINQDKCETDEPSTLEEAVDILVGLFAGDNRRVRRAAIRVTCREALRQVNQQTAPRV